MICYSCPVWDKSVAVSHSCKLNCGFQFWQFDVGPLAITDYSKFSPIFDGQGCIYYIQSFSTDCFSVVLGYIISNAAQA